MDMIYSRIKSLRKEQKLTQAELAEKLGYDRSSISKIEKGLVDLSIDKVKEFAKVLQCTPEYLMGWDEETVFASMSPFPFIPTDFSKMENKTDDTSNKADDSSNEPDNIPALPPPKTFEVKVTEAEKKMLKKFRKLNSHHKEAVNDMIVAYYRTDNHIAIRGQMPLFGFEPNWQDEDEDDD